MKRDKHVNFVVDTWKKTLIKLFDLGMKLLKRICCKEENMIITSLNISISDYFMKTNNTLLW